MGARGPIPKDPTLRQRRNKMTTAAKLAPVERLEMPDLPARGRRQWHPFTLAWWEDVRESPMAAEYVKADLHGLFVLADLVDQYWKKPAVKLAAEIRQQRQCFGLTPIDRRRLQWEIQRVEATRENPPVSSSRRNTGGDPRDLFRVVS